MNFFRTLFTKLFIIQLFLLSTHASGQPIDANIHEDVKQQSHQIFDNLKEIRRDFHEYPEVAGEEGRTSSIIAEYLKELGLEVHTNVGGYGVVGILHTNKKGKRIAWRADIDALSTEHPDVVEFQSKNEGVRHICGHDVHATIGLGIANVLTSLKDRLSGTVYFIFQPAEENWKGAKAMLDDGILDMINPDEIYALHIAPMAQGIIATKPNNLYADYKGLEIAFKKPVNKEATITYAKQLILELQNVAPDSKYWDNRNLMDPSIGLGNPNTIFRDYVTINSKISVEETTDNLVVKAYLSAEKETQLDSLISVIRHTIESSDYAQQLQGVSFFNEMSLVLNDKKLTALTVGALSELYGNDHVLRLYGAIPDGRSDDFSLFQKQVPGVYFLLGASNFQKGIISMPHSPNFAVDENSIKTGVTYFSSMIVERLKE